MRTLTLTVLLALAASLLVIDAAIAKAPQIDTPEVYFGTECYGPQASALTKRLLWPGTPVRLLPEPATDRIDDYGRLLRYVFRVKDGLNVNVKLVRVGAAAPYFYEGRRGKYAALLERLALRARAARLGLWGQCGHTPYDPNRGVRTLRPRSGRFNSSCTSPAQP
jgi:endonuclease YncB( thermonuclease family)